MKAQVFVAIKPGEERRYATATGWSQEFVETLSKNGYAVIAVEFDLPAWLAPSDALVDGEISFIREEMVLYPEASSACGCIKGKPEFISVRPEECPIHGSR